MAVMIMMMPTVQMSANLPSFLSALAHYLSLAFNIIIQLYGHIAFYADVIVNWLLSNVLMYVLPSALSVVTSQVFA